MMKFSKTLALSSILILNSSFIYAQPNSNADNYNSKVDLTIQPAVLGLWKLADSPQHCTEYYNFTAKNNKLVVKSGKEWVIGQYLYSFPTFHENKPPMLMWEIKYDNNEVDCHGQKVDQSGDMALFNVKWNGVNQMQLCDVLSEKCFMTLERVQP